MLMLVCSFILTLGQGPERFGGGIAVDTAGGAPVTFNFVPRQPFGDELVEYEFPSGCHERTAAWTTRVDDFDLASVGLDSELWLGLFGPRMNVHYCEQACRAGYFAVGYTDCQSEPVWELLAKEVHNSLIAMEKTAGKKLIRSTSEVVLGNYRGMEYVLQSPVSPDRYTRFRGFLVGRRIYLLLAEAEYPAVGSRDWSNQTVEYFFKSFHLKEKELKDRK